MARTRLAPQVFKVPIDKIRAGYYSDKYFLRVSQILRKEQHNPRVLYQFFVRKPAVVVGLDEVLAILQYCTGYYADEQKAKLLYRELRETQYKLYSASPGGNEEDVLQLSASRHSLRQQLNSLWVNCRDQVLVKALYDGDRVDPWEPFLTIEGPQQYFAYLETILLGTIARPTATATATAKVVHAARGKPILFFPARFDHFWVQATDGYAAMKAGAFGVSTDANAYYWGAEGLGTIPHALIGAYGGSTSEACLAFDRCIDGNVNRIALVDWENDCIGTTLKVVKAYAAAYCGSEAVENWPKVIGPGKNKLWGVRFDTGKTLRDKSIVPQDQLSLGVCPELVYRARQEFDKHGMRELKIMVSGGFDAKRIEMFEKLALPVDSYGVGSSLFQEKIDVTADVVKVNGRHCAKFGRKAGNFDRLEYVEP
ncbi:nicotinate phosphoribosyltransferase [candidate division KSB3 bacterium]|uniref:nicotinate phosphoribosyltransferase n=1 Tax=candidate division KSB3 bacterium TaxID=2044937 RepID=A0A2G6E9Z7_9BACT|nr:MAG: nicotinate phosphoribosyltransferase [candidate division KSB3 bacterium]PIE30968.1 MAG: nicotinate phosphoribosyltransferase [candidate division KSB3 bacterium]